MNIIRINVAFLALSLNSLLGQQLNWEKLFDGLTNDNLTISDAARAETFGTVIPRLVTEDVGSLKLELKDLLPQFNRNEKIRLQASGFLYTVSFGRKDSALALEEWFPILMKQLNDPHLRVRYNAALTISALQPSIPVIFMEPLRNATENEDARTAVAAVSGLGRLAATNEQAATLLDSMVTTAPRPELKLAALNTIYRQQLRQPRYATAAIAALDDSDSNVVKEAVRTLELFAPSITKRVTPKIRELQLRTKDTELRDLAQRLLQHMER